MIQTKSYEDIRPGDKVVTTDDEAMEVMSKVLIDGHQALRFTDLSLVLVDPRLMIEVR